MTAYGFEGKLKRGFPAGCVRCRGRPPAVIAMWVSHADLVKRTLLVVGVALIPVLVWYLFDVIVIAFGAVVVAMLLWLGAEPFMRWLRLGETSALLFSGLVILAVLAGVAFLFGTRFGSEFQDVIDRVSSGAAGIQSYLEGSDFGKLISEHVTGSSFSVAGVVTKFLTVGSTVITGVVISLVTGIYLAAQPRLYRDGFIQLFPPKRHAWAGERVDAIVGALRLWLIGQLIQMVLIGALATVIVWLLGVPAPIALGVIAGLGEFIPYIGPILAAIPAILVALTVSWETALWTVAAYVFINQVEGHLVIPLIQRRLVFIPPAMILLGVAAFTALFGPAAVIFAAPMSVVIFIAVKVLYVRDVLGEATAVPGEKS